MDLCLGTVQLGQKYGISGSEQPSAQESQKILEQAYRSGIRYYDTAATYGTAEELIGEFISTLNIEDEVHIISKVVSHKIDVSMANCSLDKLKIKQMDGYLIHDFTHKNSNSYKKSMINIKHSGLIKNIGASIYNIDDALFAANCDWIDYIQIPYNIFDHRLDKTEFFQTTKRLNKKVFARSVLLQGLLTMSIEECQKKMPEAVPYLKRYFEIAGNTENSRIEVALQYIKANPGIDFIVFGVNSTQQLNGFIDCYNKAEPDDHLVEMIKDQFSNVEEIVIRPDLWRSSRQ